MEKIKIQIKSVLGKILFEYEKENNTVKDTVIEAVETRADLTGASLSRADLTGASLSGADLTGASLSGADLTGANLTGANLTRANLTGANLTRANLTRADLTGAYLTGAYLSRANLTGADLTRADIENPEILKKFFWIIPEEGSFIGWKKLENNCIAKLLIPAEAKRTCNLKNPRKCRAEFVDVLEIKDSEGNDCGNARNSNHANKIIYKVGERAYPDSYDDSILEDCSHGIHFFITRQEAIEW